MAQLAARMCLFHLTGLLAVWRWRGRVGACLWNASLLGAPFPFQHLLLAVLMLVIALQVLMQQCADNLKLRLQLLKVWKKVWGISQAILICLKLAAP